MRIRDWSLRFYRLPYGRRVVWANAVEDAGLFALLELHADNGAAGIAEGTIKSTWSGVTPRSLAAALEELVLPMVMPLDIADLSAVSHALALIPENRLAKAMVDNACWTMRAADAGMPLWRLWAGSARTQASTPLSWTLTRQTPVLMALEAENMCRRYGFRTLKVKGGQGTAIDVQALRAIRRAVGPQVVLVVDANSAYPLAEAAAYIESMAAEGAAVVEDPCTLRPNHAFAELQSKASTPILIDASCISAKDAALYAECGARALSAKPGRIGFTEAREIAAIARAHNGGIAIGIYAESALGSLINLQLAAALDDDEQVVAAEQSFFLTMREQVVGAPLEIREGCLMLPQVADLRELIDAERLLRFSI